MAISLVSMGPLATGASGTSIAPSFGQATSAGNLLVARIVYNRLSNGSPTTTASGWVLAVDSNVAGAAGVMIWYKPNCGAGETAPVFTTSTLSFYGADLTEFAGAATSPLDKTNFADFNTASNTSSTAADAQAGSLAVMGWFGINSKSATATFSDSWSPAGGTAVAAQDNGSVKNTIFSRMSAYVTSSNASGDTDTMTVTPSTGTMTPEAWAQVTFSPGPAVTVTGISPTSGLAGDTVTITGTLFTGATDVTFEGVSASSFTVNSDTSITATAPPGAGGPGGLADIQVHIPGGVSPAISADQFRYLPNARPVVILNQAINRASRW